MGPRVRVSQLWEAGLKSHGEVRLERKIKRSACCSSGGTWTSGASEACRAQDGGKPTAKTTWPLSRREEGPVPQTAVLPAFEPT